MATYAALGTTTPRCKASKTRAGGQRYAVATMSAWYGMTLHAEQLTPHVVDSSETEREISRIRRYFTENAILPKTAPAEYAFFCAMRHTADMPPSR